MKKNIEIFNRMTKYIYKDTRRFLGKKKLKHKVKKKERERKDIQTNNKKVENNFQLFPPSELGQR